MNIILTAEIESALVAEAQKRSVAPEALALGVLHDRFVADYGQNETDGTGTLADFLAPYIGTFHSGDQQTQPAELTESNDADYVQYLLEKWRRGKL
ncbi:MAG: hypothetical protein KDD73_09465 [Anaerolineales bacterium]|nr:hypothetical protein [Anaerolineales bacterium]MCB9126961.1 hypothetical protein [Ardenticatenales bacterium]